MVALSLIVTLPACRKLGLDDTPRVSPDGAPIQLGPKHQPIAQHSSLNTPAARRAAQTGAISPDPASMASITAPANDPYNYYGNNFWANGNGWSATPPATLNAAPPTPQAMPPMAYYPPVNPALPPLSALSQPSTFAMGSPAMQMPQQIPQQQAYNPYAPAPAYNPVGSFGMQQTPPAPQQFANPDFPQLQDTPNSPFYRSQQEIAGDIASLQNQSLGNGWQNTPSYPTSPAGNFSQPVALQDNFGYQQPQNNNYGGGYNPNMQPNYANGMDNGYSQSASLPQNLPPFGAQQGGAGMNNGYGGNPYDSSAFVPPAPVAGVAEAPAMTQDWDRNAYNQQGGGSAYGTNANNQPLQLQAPYGSGRQAPALPSSRYQGRSTNRGAAMPATMDYGGY